LFSGEFEHKTQITLLIFSNICTPYTNVCTKIVYANSKNNKYKHTCIFNSYHLDIYTWSHYFTPYEQYFVAPKRFLFDTEPASILKTIQYCSLSIVNWRVVHEILSDQQRLLWSKLISKSIFRTFAFCRSLLLDKYETMLKSQITQPLSYKTRTWQEHYCSFPSSLELNIDEVNHW